MKEKRERSPGNIEIKNIYKENNSLPSFKVNRKQKKDSLILDQDNIQVNIINDIEILSSTLKQHQSLNKTNKLFQQEINTNFENDETIKLENNFEQISTNQNNDRNFTRINDAFIDNI